MILSFVPLASDKHIEEVVRIDAEGVPPTWSANDFRKTCRQGNYHAYVLEIIPSGDTEGVVVGFVAIEALNKRVNIINIGVAAAYRRQGYGQAMVTGVRSRFPNCSLHALAFENNLEFQLFLKSCHMICTAIVHGDNERYLFELPEDSIGC